MKFRIYYEDTDAAGIVYHANYIKFCERARSEMFFTSRLKPFDESGYFVVSEICAKFIKPAKLGDLIEVRTKIIELMKVRAVINQKIYKVAVRTEPCEPELLFSADITVAFMDKGKPVKMDEDITKFLSSYA